MDLHDAIATRRTIQRYTGTPVPKEALQRAFEAAHWAPCRITKLVKSPRQTSRYYEKTDDGLLS